MEKKIAGLIATVVLFVSTGLADASLVIDLPYLNSPFTSSSGATFTGNGFVTAINGSNYYNGFSIDNAHSYFQANISGAHGKYVSSATLSFFITGTLDTNVVISSFTSNGTLGFYFPTPPGVISSNTVTVYGGGSYNPASLEYNELDLTAMVRERVYGYHQYFALYMVGSTFNLYLDNYGALSDDVQLRLTLSLLDAPPVSTPTSLTLGSPGYLYLNNSSTNWQNSIWQSSTTSSRILWTDGCDAIFIGSGGIYSVLLGSPVTVRDIGLTGGQLSISSTSNRITLTDPRDGYPTIDVNSGSSLSFDVPMSASSGLVRAGAGDVVFNSPVSVNGSLMLLSGATVINNTAAVSGTTTVDGSLTVNGTMSSSTLEVSKSGATWINGRLRADNTENFGFLKVNGILESPVNNRGFLGGTGRINGSVYNHRIISPGNSIGTLTINGSYTHGPGATFIAEIDQNGGGDLLFVTGQADINGGTVSTSLPRALYTDGYSWNFLQASGGIKGQFAALTGQPNSSILDLTLEYTSSQAAIKLNRRSYATFADNKGTQSIGYALDSYVPFARNQGDAMEYLLIAMDFDYSPAGISSILSELNSEIYPTFLAVEQQAAQRFSKSMTQRSSLVRELHEFKMEKSLEKAEIVVPRANGGELKVSTASPDWLAWGKAQGESVFKDSTSDYNSYDFKTGGAVIGADTRVSEAVRIGIATAFETTDIEWQQGVDGNQDNIMVGLYAEGQYGGFYVEAQGSVGFYDNHASRSVFSTPGNVDFDGQSYMFHLGGGYDIQYESSIFGPVASLSCIHARTGEFSESGDLALNVDDSSEDIFLSYLGIHTASIILVGESRVVAKLELGWQHDFHGDEFEMRGWYDNYPSFTFSGPGLDQDMLIAAAEATVTLRDQLSAYVELGGAVGEDIKAYNVSVGLQWLF